MRAPARSPGGLYIRDAGPKVASRGETEETRISQTVYVSVPSGGGRTWASPVRSSSCTAGQPSLKACSKPWASRRCSGRLKREESHRSPPCLGGGGAENADYNFHSRADTHASIVGSHFWVHVLQLPLAGQATHTPVYFCWTRTLAIVGKHVLQLRTPRPLLHLPSAGGSHRSCILQVQLFQMPGVLNF